MNAWDKKRPILAIETSCDETAAAVMLEGRTVLSSIIASQMDTHALYGGVVPEIASRMHTQCVDMVVHQALTKAGVRLDDLGAIAVTYGPGLVGALLVGVAYAKGLAYALDVPLVGVNHIEGHVYANFISHPQLQPPFLCLIVSGGHSHLVTVENYGEYRLIGRTRDDAAGEAFDKVARVLGLGYPGGPAIDEAAKDGREKAYTFTRPLRDGLDFSFSGLKTQVINLVHGMRQRDESIPVHDLAASFRRSVVDDLLDKTMRAAQETGAKTIALAGGVSANELLRNELFRRSQALGMEAKVPELWLCTDNAAMIGCAGFYRAENGDFADLMLNAQPTLSMLHAVS